MKTYLFYIGILFSFIASAQNTGKDVTVSEKQNDDTYLSGENIRMEAPVTGDVVIAGGNIVVNDTVYQDMLVAGGEISVTGYVADDIRAAGGKLTMDSEVGDDVIVAGGEVHITKNAIIHGNLINFSGEIDMDGEVKGMIKSYSGDLRLNGKVDQEVILYGADIIVNGEIGGTSKIVAEDIKIGNNAKFHGDVEYYSEDTNVDFKNSLVNTNATYNEELMVEREEFSWRGFGIMAFGFWVFYLLSAFLVLLALNWAFHNFFTNAAANWDKQLLKSLGYGMIYIFGIPLVIAILFVIIIGIPLGIFLGGFYIFSLVFGHLVTALLLSHYLAQKPERKWNFWTIVLLALGIAAVIRLFTFIPFLGGLIAIVVIAIGYGLIGYALLQKRASLRLGT